MGNHFFCYSLPNILLILKQLARWLCNKSKSKYMGILTGRNYIVFGRIIDGKLSNLEGCKSQSCEFC